MKKLHPATRILLVVAVLSMLGAYRLPMWEIQLWAPQYPEGLNMKIWLDHLSGDFDIINGLNHYIGMALIKEEMFPEFKFMGYALGFLIFMGLLPVIIGRRIFLQVFVAILFMAAALGLWDFYSWGHQYGHNLDPKAAISVPGMTYDPPIIGYKNLLNFTAYSGPDKGGWILIVAGGIAVALLVWEFWRTRKARSANMKPGDIVNLTAVLGALMFLPGCKQEAQAIDFGKDACAECNMTIVDKRFGAEFVTGKGKVFKFDDVNCMVEFIKRDPHASDSTGKRFLVAFNEGGVLVEQNQLVFVNHTKLRTPMRSHIAAFRDKQSAQAALDDLGEGGRFLIWEDVMKAFPAP
jgi:copper chaperone NosL